MSSRLEWFIEQLMEEEWRNDTDVPDKETIITEEIKKLTNVPP